MHFLKAFTSQNSPEKFYEKLQARLPYLNSTQSFESGCGGVTVTSPELSFARRPYLFIYPLLIMYNDGVYTRCIARIGEGHRVGCGLN